MFDADSLALYLSVFALVLLVIATASLLYAIVLDERKQDEERQKALASRGVFFFNQF